MNKLICFDLDGTIVDSFGCACKYHPPMLKKHFGIQVSPNEIKRYFNNGWEDFTKKILKNAGVKFTDEEIKNFVEKARAERNTLKQEILPNVREILTEAKAKKIPLALVSNNEVENLKIVLKNNNLENFFDLLVGDDMVDFAKPHGDMYRLAYRHFGLKPEECIAIEDSSTGVRAALDAKIKVLAVATGVQKATDLAKLNPSKVIPNLSHITLEEILKI